MRPAGTFDVSYADDMAIVRTRAQWIMLAVFFATLFALPQLLIITPFLEEIYWLHIVSTTGFVLIAVLGLHITTGLCGQINLGQSAFMAVGAYTTAILTGTLGLPFLVALPCAGIMAGTVGIIFGAPALRIKEFYLAMATLAAQFIIIWVIVHIDAIIGMKLTAGAYGLDVPFVSIGGLVFDTPVKMYYLIMVIMVIMGLFALNITRTRVGRAFIAVRDNDLAAEVMGVNLFYYKLLSFFIGCSFAGVAGSLFAHYYNFIGFEHFRLHDSVWYLGMIIIGGMGSPLGAVMGTVFVRGLDVASDNIAPILSATFPFLPPNIVMPVRMIVFAFVVIIFLIYEPRGLAHRWRIFKASYRLWPYAY